MESDKKAVEEFRREYKKSGYCCVECSLNWVELFIRKTRQEAREEERHRILDLPCMQEESEEGGVTYTKFVNMEKLRNMGRNSLRREIRDALQSK